MSNKKKPVSPPVPVVMETIAALCTTPGCFNYRKHTQHKSEVERVALQGTCWESCHQHYGTSKMLRDLDTHENQVVLLKREIARLEGVVRDAQAAHREDKIRLDAINETLNKLGGGASPFGVSPSGWTIRRGY